jgi:hypothetical protein
MRSRLPQAEKTGLAITIHFAVCTFVCGLAVFGFYKLMQPERNANPGIAAYTPPPRTVINYPVAAQFRPNQMAISSPVTDVPPTDTADETIGRAIQTEETATPRVDQSPAIAPTPTPAEKPVAKRAVAARQNSTATRGRASVTHYYPSARFGPYPGYAAVH